MKAQDWPSTLRRGAGHARWPLGGRMSADEGPNLVEKTPSEAMETSDEVVPGTLFVVKLYPLRTKF